MADPQQGLTDFVKQHPQYSAYVQIPEIGALLVWAIAAGWIDPVTGTVSNPTAFGAAFQNTEWYKTHPASSRDWLLTKVTDPASALKLVNDTNRRAQALLRDMGVTLTQEMLPQFALLIEAATSEGWDEERLSQTLASYLLPTDFSEFGGSLQTNMETVRGIASEYGLPVSDKRAGQLARSIATGEGTLEAIRADYSKLAAHMFPAMADAIDRGLTVRQAADSYIQSAAQLLELDPDEIDLTDGKWQRFLNDPDAKEPSLMSLDRWQQTLMSESRYGWEKTANAKSAAYDLVDELGKTLGVVG